MQLTNTDKDRIYKFYRDALRQHGPHSPKSLRWFTARDQWLRFDMLAKIGHLSGHSILDVGCGVGDMYDYLQKNYLDFIYLGIDIVPEMIEQARLKYPGAAFETADIFSFTKPFDYIMASGSLTFNVAQGRQFYFDMVGHMFRLARKGVAFNVLDSRFHKGDKTFLVYDRQEFLPVCRRLTKDFQIIDGYELGDFTVHMRK